MNRFFRAIIAAWGAKKLGGGCLSTIVIFIIIYTLLGKCGNDSRGADINPAPVRTDINKATSAAKGQALKITVPAKRPM